MDEKGPPDPAKAAAKPALIREVYKNTRQNQKVPYSNGFLLRR